MGAGQSRAVSFVGLILLLFAAPLAAQTPPAPRSGASQPLVQPEVPDDPPRARSAEQPATIVRGVSTPQRGIFTSVQVNVDALGNNIPGDAANESTIAIDPTNPMRMAIAWRQFDTVASNFRQAGVAYSTDAGQSWTFPGVLDPGQFRSDPILAADASGTFYYSSLSTLSSAEVFKSIDGGVTWMLPPVSAFGGDKQWMIADRTAGIGSGNIYQIWNVQFSCCPDLDFTRSTNGGASFEGPFALPLPSMKWGTLDVGPDGTLFLAGATLGQSSHLVARSSNARDPAQTPTFDFVNVINLGGTTSTGGPNPAGLLGQVWVATDRSGGLTNGNVYVLGSVNPPGSDPVDVMFIRSTDGGLNWSAPVRVNDDPTNNDAYQWFGTMSVAPNGRIDVVWNDTRNTGITNMSELFYSFSIDAGVSWSPNIPVSPVFDSFLGFPNQNKIGDYYHMVSDNVGANLAYAATFNGEQDVYFLRIGQDCNGNGNSDLVDIFTGFSTDCNNNHIPDSCESLADCNANGIQDFCDIASGSSGDCNANGLPDECEIDQNSQAPGGPFFCTAGCDPDCNNNGIPDTCDITAGTSGDCNGNGIPDECEIDQNSPAPGGPFFCTAGCDPDCNNNGIPDICEVDCNANGIPDDCDVDPLDPDGNGQVSADCQPDAIPDECQIAGMGLTYQIDDGSHEVTSGIANGGSVAWMNRFVVQPGLGRIDAISLAWGAVADGTPAVVYLWSDPNGDGDPTDAQVLASAATTTQNANTDILSTVSIPVTFVGPAGTSFFAGAIITHQAGEKPVSSDRDNPPGQSWLAGDDTNPIDPNNLGAAALLPVTLSSDTALVRARAIAGDCNANSIPDVCDITSGTSLDCNGNTIPDECEFPGCPGILLGDMNCDTKRDGRDVQRFVDALVAGRYTCQADMNQDGVLSLLDVPGLVSALLGLP